MRGWARYLLCGAIGLAAGTGAAAWAVRTGAMASGRPIGPWMSGSDFGSAGQSALTRAVVARRGLLAPPAREARYYTASADDAGRLLDGRCRYRITGGTMAARWWSLTVYDHDGYLAEPGPWSVGDAQLAGSAQRQWSLVLAPDRQPGPWLSTAGLDRFDLTLRAYLPPDGGRTDPPRDGLPTIRREACA